MQPQTTRFDHDPGSPPGARVQVHEHVWSDGWDASRHSFAPRVPALVIVEGGTVVIERADRPTSLLDPAHALLVWPGDGVRIRRGAPDATRCTVMQLEPAIVVGAHARWAAARGASILAFWNGFVPLTAQALFQNHRLRRMLGEGVATSDECLDRSACAMLSELVVGPDAGQKRRTRGDARCGAARRAAVERAQAILASAIDAPHPLADVARALGTSPFHLAHIFQEEVGMALHKYLVRLRLLAALGPLSTGTDNLSRLALELGFSHHSHFTAAFRRTFGRPPSEVRRLLTAIPHSAPQSDAAESARSRTSTVRRTG